MNVSSNEIYPTEFEFHINDQFNNYRKSFEIVYASKFS